MGEASQVDFPPKRLVSLDAYRGLIMLALAFNGFGLGRTALRHLQIEPDSQFWQAVRHQFDHVQWVGCSFWDLIQPSFMFMVGAAMAFSYGRRQEEGQSWLWMFFHAIIRALLLIFIGIFLISSGRPSTRWSLVNVLTQIGLGYPILFLLWRRPAWLQATVAALLIGGTWLLYVSYSPAGIDIQTGNKDVGVEKKWAAKNLANVPPAWHKNANVGYALDSEIFGRSPRRQLARTQLIAQAVASQGFASTVGGSPAFVQAAASLEVGTFDLASLGRRTFRFDTGGYTTLNFVPALATMIFGLMAGELLRSSRAAWIKWAILVAAGLAGLGVGYLLDWTNLCPLIKRIWTPSFTLFSAGWCLLILSAFYGVVDGLGWKKWTFPLVVLGVNSIAVYCMYMLLPTWVAGSFRTHFGPSVFRSWGQPWEPTVQALTVGLVFWLVALWMYRHKIYVRI